MSRDDFFGKLKLHEQVIALYIRWQKPGWQERCKEQQNKIMALIEEYIRRAV
jgi:hypothetical protein